jgi:hypothetical protein
MRLSPFWYAVGSVFAVPLCVIACLVWCVFILLVWPAIPFVFYHNRKKELSSVERAKAEAVKLGFAEWVSDYKGNTTFKWKEGAE